MLLEISGTFVSEFEISRVFSFFGILLNYSLLSQIFRFSFVFCLRNFNDLFEIVLEVFEAAKGFPVIFLGIFVILLSLLFFLKIFGILSGICGFLVTCILQIF